MTLEEEAPPAPQTHRRASSSLGDFTVLAFDHHKDETVVKESDAEKFETKALPSDSLIMLTETVNLDNKNDESILQGITDMHFEPAEKKLVVHDWDGTKFYSDYIKEGMEYTKRGHEKVIMLYESPSTSAPDATFLNKDKYKFHTWPEPKSTVSKATLGPCRYALMNGPSYPTFLRMNAPPAGLAEHWKETVPGYVEGTYVNKITEEQTAYCYLPIEQIKNHVNDPSTHYHLAGKDAIHLMTQKTTKLLPDTRVSRPCVVKTTHSMGSKGIFIINNDEDEAEFEQYLADSGNPTFVVTDFVDIARNVACHFFMHPDGSITWFGSNENHREADGKFSSDSYLLMEHQEKLKEIQLPFVAEVVKYCHGLGFWGFCGVDVLFDSKGNGYLVDINPRVTGSCPALMTLKLLKDKYGFSVALFRRSGGIVYKNTPEKLMEEVKQYNDEHMGKSCIVIHSMFQPNKSVDTTKINIGVYGNNLGECKEVLTRFAGKAASA